MQGLLNSGDPNDPNPSSTPANPTQPSQALDLSIVISTRNRAESLQLLLDCIVSDDREGIAFEVVVVDNGDSEETREVARAYSEALNLRYLVARRPGKCHAMNCALDEGELGEIVAFLDDDLNLEHGWLGGVKRGCARWPEHDIFSGRSHVVFPEGVPVPDWARKKMFDGWAFSVNDPGTEDHEMKRGWWPSGNHFWVRSRVLKADRRFPDLWILPEPGLILGLQEDGHRGMWIGDVVAGHRIQPHLLEQSTILLRMAQFGRDYPYVRLPNPTLFWQARFFRDHPLVWILLNVANLIRWYLKYLCAFVGRDGDARFLKKITSTIRVYDSMETILHWRRIRRFVSCGQKLPTAVQEDTFGRFYDQA